jgi:LacI family transcriptional regulator
MTLDRGPQPMTTDLPTRVTIAEIAEQAGVSVPTVSRVLNGRPGVAPDTRGRVEHLLQQHDYRRRVARPGTRTGFIDLVVENLDSPWALEVIVGVEPVMHAAGFSTVIHDNHDSAETRAANRSWLKDIEKRPSDGVVLAVGGLTPRQRTRLDTIGLPFVIVDPIGHTDATTTAIGATNWAGGLAATEHLIGLGHTRIGLVGGPANLMCSRARADGYRNALQNAGIAVDEQLIDHGQFKLESGHRQALRLLRSDNPPSALFANSDQQALGVYDAARELGLRIPEDLSVVGFDDLPSSAWIQPRLTTVRQPIRQMAATAAQALLKSVLEGPQPATRMELATTLVVRESTAPVR